MTRPGKIAASPAVRRGAFWIAFLLAIVSAHASPTSLVTRESYETGGAVQWSKTAGARGKTSYRFEPEGRLREVAYADGTVVRIDYDANGRATAIAGGSGRIAVEYEAGGLPRQVSYDDSTAIGYEWENGRLKSLTYPDRSVAGYAYDDARRLASVRWDSDKSASYLYTDEGLVAQRTLPNGWITRYRYSGKLLPVSIEHADASGAIVWGAAYEYDASGRMLGKRVQANGLTEDIAYAYDANGALTEEWRNGQRVRVYEYDARGNRSAVTEGYNEKTVVVNDASGEIRQYGPQAFTYEAGQLLADGRRHWRWNAGGRPVEIVCNGRALSYAYNDLGGCTQRASSGRAVSYVQHPFGSGAVMQMSGPGSESRNVIWGTDLIGTLSSSQVMRYYFADALGSVVLIVNGNGENAEFRGYDAFGNPDVVFPEADFGFLGELHDAQAGIVLRGTRPYDTVFGRFPCANRYPPDPLDPRSFNAYAYCGNDPVNQADRFGIGVIECPWRRTRCSDRLFPWDPLAGGDLPHGISARKAFLPEVVVAGLCEAIAGPSEVIELDGAADAGPHVVPPGGLTGLRMMAAEIEAFSLKGRHNLVARLAAKANHIGRVVFDRWASVEALNPEFAAYLDIALDGGLVIDEIELQDVSEPGPLLEAVAKRRKIALHTAPGPSVSGNQQTRKEACALLASTAPELRKLFVAGGPNGDTLARLGLSPLPPSTPMTTPPVTAVAAPSSPWAGNVDIEKGVSRIRGATFDRASGTLFLIGDADPVLPPIDPSLFAIASRGVFMDTQIGVTILPVTNGHPPTQQVTYFGSVEGTRLGMVAFEADRKLKCLSMGEDNLTRKPFAIDGVPDLFALSFDQIQKTGIVSSGESAHRLWIEPLDVSIEVSNDGDTVYVNNCRMIVRKENLRAGAGASPEITDFTDMVTGKYDELAQRPELAEWGELAEISKIVAIVRWIRKSNLPVSIDALLSYPVAGADTPNETPTFDSVREKAPFTVTLYGGVDLYPPETKERTYSSSATGQADRFAAAVAPGVARNEGRPVEVRFDGKSYAAVPVLVSARADPASWNMAGDSCEFPVGIPDRQAPSPGSADATVVCYPMRLSFPVHDKSIERTMNMPTLAVLRDFTEGKETIFTAHGILTDTINGRPVRKRPSLSTSDGTMHLARNTDNEFELCTADQAGLATFRADGALLSWRKGANAYTWDYRNNNLASVRCNDKTVLEVDYDPAGKMRQLWITHPTGEKTGIDVRPDAAGNVAAASSPVAAAASPAPPERNEPRATALNGNAPTGGAHTIDAAEGTLTLTGDDTTGEVTFTAADGNVRSVAYAPDTYTLNAGAATGRIARTRDGWVSEGMGRAPEELHADPVSQAFSARGASGDFACARDGEQIRIAEPLSGKRSLRLKDGRVSEVRSGELTLTSERGEGARLSRVSMPGGREALVRRDANGRVEAIESSVYFRFGQAPASIRRAIVTRDIAFTKR